MGQYSEASDFMRNVYWYYEVREKSHCLLMKAMMIGYRIGVLSGKMILFQRNLYGRNEGWDIYVADINTEAIK